MTSFEKEIVKLLTSEKEVNLGFQKLLEAYQRPLYLFARRMVIDHQDAHDILQDSFIRVLHGIRSFRGESSLSTWLHTIVYRESLKHIEKKKKFLSIAWNEAVWNSIQQLEEESHFEGNEIQLLLQACVSALPEKQRAVFIMKYYEEMKYEDISSVTGTSVGALKASYHHAVEKIKITIEKQKMIWKDYESR